MAASFLSLPSPATHRRNALQHPNIPARIHNILGHEVSLQKCYKRSQNSQEFPILVCSLLSLMVTELGSVAQSTPVAQRSTRCGRGRDAQLNKLSTLLMKPTYEAKKHFAPTNGLSLPDNALAPVPKRRRKTKEVRMFFFIFLLDCADGLKGDIATTRCIFAA